MRKIFRFAINSIMGITAVFFAVLVVFLITTENDDYSSKSVSASSNIRKLTNTNKNSVHKVARRPIPFINQIRRESIFWRNANVAIHQLQDSLEEFGFSSSIDHFILTDMIPQMKLSVDLVLTKRLSKEKLGQISDLVAQSPLRPCENYFIGFRLRNQVSESYWATAHRDPKLSVKILGMTGSVLTDLKMKTVKPGEKLIGAALVDGIAARKILLYQKGKYFYLRTHWKDGKETIEKLSHKGDRYLVDNDSFGQFYQIKFGKMLLGDKDGVFLEVPIFQK